MTIPKKADEIWECTHPIPKPPTEDDIKCVIPNLCKKEGEKNEFFRNGYIVEFKRAVLLEKHHLGGNKIVGPCIQVFVSEGSMSLPDKIVRRCGVFTEDVLKLLIPFMVGGDGEWIHFEVNKLSPFKILQLRKKLASVGWPNDEPLV